jgi:predicted DNA-binding antitoxin AbrB/MazE fold protein
MTYEVDAIFNNGAFVPVSPMAIREGARVHLHVDEQATIDPTGKLMSPAEMKEFLAMMESLPVESPDDGFSGVDHDKLLYGQP